MKKALKIIGSIILLSLFLILYISYIVDNNSQEVKKLEEKVLKHYAPDSKVESINQYSNYYIIKTSSKVIVLDNQYKPILEEDLNKINSEVNDQELIYKTNKLAYEKKILKDKKLTYEYYDAISGELIGKTVLEQQ